MASSNGLITIKLLVPGIMLPKIFQVPDILSIEYFLFRNLNADITRFLPTSVRIKRDDGRPKPKPERREVSYEPPKAIFSKPANPSPATAQPSKDDAYMQFMREMQEFM